ncbi:MAG: ribosomal protein S18-alanine N-acetyltransferase [Eubacteriales bacterium]|nr:ribosomal protein S18-alanine N-acetyltransferase [Eubacteriales bacterium]
MNGADGLRLVCLTAEDAAAAAALEASCLAEAWSLSAWESALADPNACYAGAWAGEKLVGCCGLWQSFEEADICNVAVDAGFRRQGIGRRLLLFLMEEGRKRGVRDYTLEVRSSNEAAIGLYRELGFLEEGRRPCFYDHPREDALILWKRQEAHEIVSGSV